MTAWLFLAAGDDRQHGGNDGYDDQPDVHYSWDDTVPNHAKPRPGDAIALWDKKRLIGASVIERIEHDEAYKILRTCPHCFRAGIKARKTRTPRYKCYVCKKDFNEPRTRVENVRTFRSWHDGGWTDLYGVLTAPELRSVCVSPKDQLSLRRLRWDAFEHLVRSRTDHELNRGLARRVGARNGHVEVTVRVRVGQAAFRRHLLRSFGQTCAITGPAPEVVLEAGHLYSYAELGVHHEHGGLLLRRDVHRLFDCGAVAINPETGLIDVRPDVRSFSQYGDLHDAGLHVPLNATQADWLRRHWGQHRA